MKVLLPSQSLTLENLILFPPRFLIVQKIVKFLMHLNGCLISKSKRYTTNNLLLECLALVTLFPLYHPWKCKDAILDSHSMNFIFKAMRTKRMQSCEDRPFFYTSSDYTWGDFSNCKTYYKIKSSGKALPPLERGQKVHLPLYTPLISK